MLGEGVEHVQIGFNAKTRFVGIRAATEDAKGRYRLRSQGNNGLHLVTGKRFFAHYHLDVEKARTFDAEQVDDGLVGFCLTEKPAEGEDTDTKAPAARKPAKKAAA